MVNAFCLVLAGVAVLVASRASSWFACLMILSTCPNKFHTTCADCQLVRFAAFSQVLGDAVETNLHSD